jgi:hypothetical protein
MAEEKTKPTIKRLKGTAYWKLQDLMAEGEKLVKDYGEWAREECRRLNLLPDVTDFVIGVIWNIPESMVTPETPRQQVKLIEDEDVIKKALEKQRDVDKFNDKIARVTRAIAVTVGVRADQVNPRTGIITIKAPEDVEDVEVDLPDDDDSK